MVKCKFCNKPAKYIIKMIDKGKITRSTFICKTHFSSAWKKTKSGFAKKHSGKVLPVPSLKVLPYAKKIASKTKGTDFVEGICKEATPKKMRKRKSS